MKSWIKYLIIAVICIVGSLLVIKQIDKTFTVERTELGNKILSLIGDKGELLEEVTSLKVQVRELEGRDVDVVILYDTLLVDLLRIDTLIKNDTTIIVDTLLRNLPRDWGKVTVVDSSNKFTNISVVSFFPSGKTRIEYRNKYREKSFRKYMGFGIEKDGLMLTANIYYKKIGLGLYIRQEGKNAKKGTIISIAF